MTSKKKRKNDLLRRDRRLSCSQNVFLNLAGRGFGKFFDEGDAVRRLEMRQVRPRKLANVFELFHSNGFNSPSMVGIYSVTVG